MPLQNYTLYDTYEVFGRRRRQNDTKIAYCQRIDERHHPPRWDRTSLYGFKGNINKYATILYHPRQGRLRRKNTTEILNT